MVQKLSKRIKGVAAFVLAVTILLLSACSSGRTVLAKTYYYTLFTENGQWFMEFRAGRMLSAKSTPPENQAPFTSPGNFVERLKAGTVPIDLLIDLWYYKSSNHIMPLLDLNKLYDLSLPEGLHYERIDWYGEYYTFTMPMDAPLSSIYCVPKDRYDFQYDYYFRDFLPEVPENILSDTTDDTGLREIYVQDWYFLDHYKLYSIQTQNQTLYVHEHQEYIDRSGKLKGKDSIQYMDATSAPVDITIFGTDGNYYFYGTLQDLKEQPSKEWLSSFALVPYQGD